MCKIMQEYEDKARDEGRKEGILLGTVKALRQLVSNGIITAAVAAQQCGMTEEAFLQAKTTI